MEISLLFYHVCLCLIQCCFYVEWYSVHINCGGKATTIGNIKYKVDVDLAGATKYARVSENWGSIALEDFGGINTSANYQYIANNVSNESEIYDRN